MASELTVLTAEFPRAVRGYAVEAVDEFVEEIGSRLNALQAELTKQAARGDRLASDLANNADELASYREKEKAMATVMIAAEERRAKVEVEAEAKLADAEAAGDEIIKKAKAEAEKVKAHSDA